MVSPSLNSAQHSPLGMVGVTGSDVVVGGGKVSGLPNLPNLISTTSRSRCNSINSLHSNLSCSIDPSVETAMEAERQRIRDQQCKESDVTDPEFLKAALKRERAHSLRLTADLARFKSSSVRSQAEAEAHEEAIINGLLRRLDLLQKEKGRIIVELEREEEMLTNTLQKNLNSVRREKALLQAQIDKEQKDNEQLKAQLYNDAKA